jgi:glutathione S-transferase
MAEVTVYGGSISTYVRTVRIALAEKGIPYEHVEVWTDSPEITKRHPFRKVPAFRHRDFELYESIAITRYIDEAFPGAALQPADVKARARMMQWIALLSAYCYPTVIGQIVIERFSPTLLGKPADEAKVAAAVPNAEHQIGVFDAALGSGQYLVGREPTLADYFLYPVVFYLGMTPEGTALLERRPGLRRWMEALSQRKSVKETAPALG